MCIDVNIELVECLIKYLKKYKEYDFANVIVSAEKFVNKIEIKYQIHIKYTEIIHMNTHNKHYCYP